MIIVLKKNVQEEKLNFLINKIKEKDCAASITFGKSADLLTVTGDTYKLDADYFKVFDFVVSVEKITKPFPLSAKSDEICDLIVDVDGQKIGGGNFCFIAGPCSIESEKQIIETALKLKKIGVAMLRGGAFKPRTSPYSFQGLGSLGIEFLVKAKKETGLPIVSEITSPSQIDLFKDVDVWQIGARNMQNFELLKEVAKTEKTLLLKRGTSATLTEWLCASEYLLAGGAKNVILCERGVKSFEPTSRASLDFTSLSKVKELTKLPVIVDPSHAAGLSKYVKPLSLAATAAGADGLMIEVHDRPETALSDGAQALTPDDFQGLYNDALKILPVVGKKIR